MIESNLAHRHYRWQLMVAQLEGLEAACGVGDASRVCSRVYDWTNNKALAGLAEWVIDRPIRVLVIIALAWLINRLVRRSIGALSDRIRATPSHPRLQQLRSSGPGGLDMDRAEALRAPARAEAVEGVLKSLVTIVVWIIAGLLILSEFQVNLAPLIAGAGIVGIAVGFGAQSIVADFLSGMFMLLEDQYGIGDVIEVGDVTGKVENVSLRTTKLRDQEGTVWHIPNSEIKRVGNHSQIWSNAVLDLRVGLEADLRQCMKIMDDVAGKLWEETHEDGAVGDIIEDPQVLGVQEVGDSSITLRMVVKTDPLAQWQVQRELRLRLIEAFDKAGIDIPIPKLDINQTNL
jgi:small conductance mechanosensitive channel